MRERHKKEGDVPGKQRGFTVVEGVLLIVVIGIIVFASWFVWNSQRQTSQVFDDANKSGSAAGMSNTTTPLSTTSSTGSTKIPRWGVQLPVKGYEVFDLWTSDSVERYSITNGAIIAAAKKVGCADTSIGWVVKTASKDGQDPEAASSKKINGYYYIYLPRTEVSCPDGAGNGPQTLNELQDAAIKELTSAISGVTNVNIID